MNGVGFVVATVVMVMGFYGFYLLGWKHRRFRLLATPSFLIGIAGGIAAVIFLGKVAMIIVGALVFGASCLGIGLSLTAQRGGELASLLLLLRIVSILFAGVGMLLLFISFFVA